MERPTRVPMSRLTLVLMLAPLMMQPSMQALLVASASGLVP